MSDSEPAAAKGDEYGMTQGGRAAPGILDTSEDSGLHLSSNRCLPGRSRYFGRGPYEVFEYESTLELLDREGNNAAFKKREKERHLQDNIIDY